MSSRKEIKILETIPSLRNWRQQFIKQDKQVAFIPTMGSLHEGHLSLGKVTIILSQIHIYILLPYCNSCAKFLSETSK
jgi:hypothetical protein